MTLRTLDGDRLDPAALCDALRKDGCLRLRHRALPPARHAAVMQAARAFFDLPGAIKSAIAIERSAHFRGYSEMKNERDFREQLHLGAELPPAGDAPAFHRLEGPNLWPPDPAFRERMLQHLADVTAIGREVLAAIAAGLRLPASTFNDAPGLDPYLVMKLICYHPRPRSGEPRPGVAAHVDFSLVTLTLQDETGGLEMRRPDGQWIAADPVPGTLLVHLGEVLAFATGGQLPATPHRVINRRSDRSRVSIPVFLCPALKTVVSPIAGASIAGASIAGVGEGARAVVDDEHVHRVLVPGGADGAFHFGEAEWRRKGLNVWCADCVRA